MALAKKTKPRTVKVYPFVPVEILTWAKKEVTRRRRKNVHDDSTAQSVLAELLIAGHAIATAKADGDMLEVVERVRGKRMFVNGAIFASIPASQPEAP